MSYLNLEHKLIELFRLNNFSSQIIVCVSGGADSLALLSALAAVKKQLKLDLKALYIHHGYGVSKAQSTYRDQAGDLVKLFCEENKVKLLSNYMCSKNLSLKPVKILKSESDLRQFRESVIEKFAVQYPSFKFAFAHHAQDLMENRFIQMIRGASTNGFLSMRLKDDLKLRPFLTINKKEILSYLSNKKISYIEDPSNLENSYLRNWLRNEWLPRLEAYRKGSVKTLSHSMQNIAEDLNSGEALWSEQWAKVYNAERRLLNLYQLLLLSPFEQRKCIAEFLSLNGVTNFSRNQLNEVLKHLDSDIKVHRFKIMGFEWSVRDDELNVCKK